MSKECCKETKGKFNPFQFGQKKNKARFLDFGDMVSPIKGVLQDTKEVRKFFEKFPYIPYSGADKITSHRLVCKLQEMGDLSSTKGAIMNSINCYSFGAKIGLYKGEDTEFDMGEESTPLEGEERQSYRDFLRRIELYGETYNGITEKISNLEQTTGEYFIECILDEVEGERFFGMSIVEPAKVCEKFTNAGEPRVFGISDRWDYTYCKKNPPRDIPAYPNVEKQKDGTLRTIIHVKNGCKRRGRPRDLATFTDQHNEYHLKEYLSKAIGGNFMGQVLIEIEDSAKGNPFGQEAAEQSGYADPLDLIEQNWTNRGEKPTSVIAFTRPKGARPVTTKQFSPNTNEKFYCKVLAELRGGIIEGNNWSEALIRMSHSSGFNSEMYKDIFSILSATTILKHQERTATGPNLALNIASEWLEEDQKGNQIKYISPIQTLLKQIVEAETETQKAEEIEI